MNVHMPEIPAFWRQRQENLKFEATLSYMASPRPAWTMEETLSEESKQTNKRAVCMHVAPRLLDS